MKLESDERKAQRLERRARHLQEYRDKTAAIDERYAAKAGANRHRREQKTERNETRLMNLGYWLSMFALVPYVIGMLIFLALIILVLVIVL